MGRFRMGTLSASDADALNRMADAIDRIKRMSVAPPMSINWNSGIPSIAAPQAFPEILAEVTVVSSDTPPVYTCKRVTRGNESPDENEVVDYIPEDLYEQVIAPTGSGFAVGDLVMLVDIPDWRGWYWAVPARLNSSWKNVVRCATTVNGTLATDFENGDTVDGVTLVTGDRILLKNQSTGAENGIYTVNATGAPTRASDANTDDSLVGAVVWVSEGTTNADTIWACTTNAPITIGVTSTAWVKVYPGPTAWKDPVRLRATANITVSSPGSTTANFDGLTPATNDRILLTQQSTASENGLYLYNGSGVPLTRTEDADSGAEMLGATVYVSEGTIWADTYFTCTTNATITIGVTNLTFAQTPSANPEISGYVNIIAQTFRGAKTFIDQASTATNPGSVTITPSTSPTAGVGFSQVKVLGPDTLATLAGSVTITATTVGNVTLVGHDPSGPGTYTTSVIIGAGQTIASAVAYYVYGASNYGVGIYGEVGRAYMTFGLGATATTIDYEMADPLGTGASVITLTFDDNIDYMWVKRLVARTKIFSPLYAYNDGAGTVTNGVTGTGGGGDTVLGGIVTALGTGPSTIDGGAP